MIRHFTFQNVLLVILSSVAVVFFCCGTEDNVVNDDNAINELFNPDNSTTHGDPYNLRVEAQNDGSILLTFNKIPTVNNTAVYRSILPDSNFQKIGISASTKYLDKKTQPGMTYYYYLRAYREDKEFPASPVNSVYTTPKDDAPMILIPAGEFQMGGADWWTDPDGKPVHTVYLDAFYIDKYEVSNAQYRRFIKETGHKEPISHDPKNVSFGVTIFEGYKPWQDNNLNEDNKPVMCVSWEDAEAYCKWAGKRLPTEAEWEKAARGGLVGKHDVWGDKWPPSPIKPGNLADETFHNEVGVEYNYIEDYNDGYAYTSPEGIFAPNGYGLYDMAGNVSEWCADWYDSSYYASSPKSNPKGPDSGQIRVYRGSCWSDLGGIVAIRYSDNPLYASSALGFRCVKDAIR